MRGAGRAAERHFPALDEYESVVFRPAPAFGDAAILCRRAEAHGADQSAIRQYFSIREKRAIAALVVSPVVPAMDRGPRAGFRDHVPGRYRVDIIGAARAPQEHGRTAQGIGLHRFWRLSRLAACQSGQGLRRKVAMNGFTKG